jgi:hypothetical protein
MLNKSKIIIIGSLVLTLATPCAWADKITDIIKSSRYTVDKNTPFTRGVTGYGPRSDISIQSIVDKKGNKKWRVAAKSAFNTYDNAHILIYNEYNTIENKNLTDAINGAIYNPRAFNFDEEKNHNISPRTLELLEEIKQYPGIISITANRDANTNEVVCQLVHTYNSPEFTQHSKNSRLGVGVGQTFGEALEQGVAKYLKHFKVHHWNSIDDMNRFKATQATIAKHGHAFAENPEDYLKIIAELALVNNVNQFANSSSRNDDAKKVAENMIKRGSAASYAESANLDSFPYESSSASAK